MTPDIKWNTLPSNEEAPNHTPVFEPLILKFLQQQQQQQKRLRAYGVHSPQERGSVSMPQHP